MEARVELVVNLHKKGKRNCEILRELKHLKVNKRFIERSIKRFRETGSGIYRHNGGRKRTVRTPKLIKKIRERIRRNNAQSARKMSKNMNLSKNIVAKIIKEDLKLKTYKKKKSPWFDDKK